MPTSHPLVMIAVRTSPVRQIVIFATYWANAADADRIGGYRIRRYVKADLSHAGTVSTGPDGMDAAFMVRTASRGSATGAHGHHGPQSGRRHTFTIGLSQVTSCYDMITTSAPWATVPAGQCRSGRGFASN